MSNLNKQAYEKLIQENIDALEKYMPEHSLEKQHTIDVLKWSIKQNYPESSERIKELENSLNVIIVMTNNYGSTYTSIRDYAAESLTKTQQP